MTFTPSCSPATCPTPPDIDALKPDATEFANQHQCSSALEVKAEVRQTAVMDDALTIGEVARRSGVATSALRFYEDQGLIQSERTDAGHRRYPRAVIRRVAFIVFAQKVGLSLDEIRTELARLPRNRVPERADWAKLSSGWTKRIHERITELERLKAGLSECIGCGCLSLESCYLSNPGDRLGRAGPGPRMWMDGRRRSL
jgi:MerR family redox-sensitive transcriptional activator SoxR